MGPWDMTQVTLSPSIRTHVVTRLGVDGQPSSPSGALGLPGLTRGEAAISLPSNSAGGRPVTSGYLVCGGRGNTGRDKSSPEQ